MNPIKYICGAALAGSLLSALYVGLSEPDATQLMQKRVENFKRKNRKIVNDTVEELKKVEGISEEKAKNISNRLIWLCLLAAGVSGLVYSVYKKDSNGHSRLFNIVSQLLRRQVLNEEEEAARMLYEKIQRENAENIEKMARAAEEAAKKAQAAEEGAKKAQAARNNTATPSAGESIPVTEEFNKAIEDAKLAKESSLRIKAEIEKELSNIDSVQFKGNIEIQHKEILEKALKSILSAIKIAEDVLILQDNIKITPIDKKDNLPIDQSQSIVKTTVEPGLNSKNNTQEVKVAQTSINDIIQKVELPSWLLNSDNKNNILNSLNQTIQPLSWTYENSPGSTMIRMNGIGSGKI